VKIEIGYKVRMDSGKIGVVEKIFQNGMMLVRTCATQSIMTSTYQVQEVIEKGEKKMKTYTGFKAIEKMKTGIIDDGNSIYRINERKNNIEWKFKFSDEWSDIPVEIGYFFSTEFTEYKEPLKHKEGDIVWVKAKIIDVRDDSNTPYSVRPLRDYAENEVKGIDE